MCRVHRIVENHTIHGVSMIGTQVYEEKNKPSSVRPYFSFSQPRPHKQFTEHLRRIEYDRLTGRTYNMDEIDPERRSPQGNLGNFQMISRDDIEERGRRRTSVRTCDRKDTVHRERDSHGFHGRKTRTWSDYN